LGLPANFHRIDSQQQLHLLFVSGALRATVDIFYNRIYADENLINFFDRFPMSRMKLHQTTFLTLMFTEVPADMDIASFILKKHARLFREKGLDETHFDLVAGHLVAALQELNVPENLIGEVVAIVGPLRSVFATEAERIKNESKE
jgi:hemoglobin